MKVISQSATIMSEQDDILKQIEERGRICYKSEDRITDDSAPKFVSGIIESGHNSVLEMAVICVAGEFIAPTKYMNISNGITSASVRAWREYYQINKLSNDQSVLSNDYPELFEDIVAKFEPDLYDYMAQIVPMPTNDLDHTYVCVKLITNRAMTHEMVRHRPSSFLQESQRYVRYDRPEGIEWIRPVGFEEWSKREKELFRLSCHSSEELYICRRQAGQSPQQARGSLANDCKTEILVYCNLREWCHIFFMRSQGGADPQMKDLMQPLLAEFRERFPGHFLTN